jgi:hypothetical protein
MRRSNAVEEAVVQAAVEPSRVRTVIYGTLAA